MQNFGIIRKLILVLRDLFLTLTMRVSPRYTEAKLSF